jgi:hypothetical protein
MGFIRMYCQIFYNSTSPTYRRVSYVIPPSNNVNSLIYLPTWSLNML